MCFLHKLFLYSVTVPSLGGQSVAQTCVTTATRVSPTTTFATAIPAGLRSVFMAISKFKGTASSHGPTVILISVQRQQAPAGVSAQDDRFRSLRRPPGTRRFLPGRR